MRIYNEKLIKLYVFRYNYNSILFFYFGKYYTNALQMRSSWGFI